MDWLADTNILLRIAQPTHPMHQEAAEAGESLLRRSDRVCIVLQKAIEFWSVATRPGAANGLGYSQAETWEELRKFEAFFTILPESPKLYGQWRQLVAKYSVSGKKVHDTRLVASMLVHGVDRLLTFDAQDFVRYAEIQVFQPKDILTGSPGEIR